MYGDRQPVEVFVSISFQNPRVLSLISGWRVEPSKLQDIAILYFREVGVFFVEPNQRAILLETMIKCLRYSPEVKTLVKKAETDENERKRTRHADI